MKRKLIALTLIVLFMFSLTSTAFAADKGKSWKAGLTAEQLEQLRNRDVKDRLTVNGTTLEYDVPPVIKEGRTLIPVRAIMNGLRAEVDWNAETKTITIKRDDVTIVLKLGETSFTVNGEVKTMDVPAQLISNRTLVPLRFIAEALGDKVSHDAETGDIEICGRLETPEKPTLVAKIATWTAVANENNGYTLTLYKNEAQVTTVAIAHGAALSYDFSASMTAAGSYTVTIKALATGDYTDSKTSKPSAAQVVGTPVPAPAAPTAPVVDDTANTFGWTNVAAYTNITDYEYSTDSGATWQVCTANPQPVGNNAYAIGAVQVRVKADTASGRPAGAALISTAAFTVTP